MSSALSTSTTGRWPWWRATLGLVGGSVSAIMSGYCAKSIDELPSLCDGFAKLVRARAVPDSTLTRCSASRGRRSPAMSTEPEPRSATKSSCWPDSSCDLVE